MKINKIESKTGGYSDIFEVEYPVRFYFVKNEENEIEYDGIEIGPLHETTEEELDLIRELMFKLENTKQKRSCLVNDSY